MVNVLDRFWSYVDETGPVPIFRPDLGPCWIWRLKPEAKGYGRFSLGRRDGRQIRIQAHRFAFELLVGPIPDGYEIDHLCRVRLCLNPAHLEPVTGDENQRRGFARELNRTNHQTRKTRCPAGHAYAGPNLYVGPKGDRRCRKCHRDRMRKVGRRRG